MRILQSITFFLSCMPARGLSQLCARLRPLGHWGCFHSLAVVNNAAKKGWCVYTKEYDSAIKSKEILPLAAAWKELEGVTLNELSQSEKNMYRMIPLVCGV